MLSEEDIDELANNLPKVEEWLTVTKTAGSALGRLVLQDQAALSRWRAGGNSGCSYDKRRALAVYILQNPEGIPGYKRIKKGRSFKVGAAGQIDRAFRPSKSPTSSRVGKLHEGSGPSTQIPVPALTELENMSDVEYIRQKAFTTDRPLVTVMAELLSLGIRCAREEEYEQERKNNGDAP